MSTDTNQQQQSENNEMNIDLDEFGFDKKFNIEDLREQYTLKKNEWKNQGLDPWDLPPEQTKLSLNYNNAINKKNDEIKKYFSSVKEYAKANKLPLDNTIFDVII